MNISPNIGFQKKPLKCVIALLLAVFWTQRVSPAAESSARPPAPSGFILDEARAMPEALQAVLSDEIRRFREATGCELWLVTNTYLSATTVRDQANALADDWIPSGHGIVLAYDRASDSHAVSPTDSMWQIYPTPALVEAFRDAGAVLQEKKVPLEQRLLSGMRLLMKRITEAEQQRALHNQPLPGHDLWAAIVFLMLLVAGALICALIIATLRKRDATNAIRYFFPQAEVAMRFGAPYGGGVIAEARISQRHP